MKSEEHAFIGGLVGLGSYISCRIANRKPVNLIEMALSAIGGAAAAVIPDVLEPPTAPNHRSIFHSLATLLLLSRSNLETWKSNELTEDQKLAFFILSTAYNSHLVMDSTTKEGLPILF